MKTKKPVGKITLHCPDCSTTNPKLDGKGYCLGCGRHRNYMYEMPVISK